MVPILKITNQLIQITILDKLTFNQLNHMPKLIHLVTDTINVHKIH